VFGVMAKVFWGGWTPAILGESKKGTARHGRSVFACLGAAHACIAGTIDAY
jgi:hypothetical protein